MNNWLRSCVPLVLGVALLVAPVSTASALDAADDVLLVVSVESIDDMLANIDYLTEIAGHEEFGTMARLMAAPFAEIIDRSMPIGALVLIDGDDISPLIFVPIRDFEALLDVIELSAEEVEELDNDIFKIECSGEKVVYLKNEGDWVFVSCCEAALEDLPSDPADYLGDLPETYVFAVQANLQNIPESCTDKALACIRAGMERGTCRRRGESDEVHACRKEFCEAHFEKMIEVFEQIDHVTFGWAVDSDAGSIYWDFSVTAVPETQLAQQMDSLQGTTSNFAGFLLPDAAVTYNSATTIPEDDVTRAVDLLEAVLGQALAKIDESDDLENDAERAAVKELVSDLFGIVSDTVGTAEMDGGGALVLGEESLTVAFGMHVADGSDVEDLFRKLAELVGDEPDFPGIEFNDSSHAGVSFHTIRIPLPDEKARDFFGDEMLVVIGTGDESVYFAFGSDPIEVLEAILDGSARNADREVLPFQLNFSLASIAQFAASVGDDEKADAVAEMLEATDGRDHISIAAFPIENGVTYRLEVESGIIEVIGEASEEFGDDDDRPRRRGHHGRRRD